MMFLPNNYYTPTKTFSMNVASSQKDEKNEIFTLQTKIVEVQKALNEEILKKTV